MKHLSEKIVRDEIIFAEVYARKEMVEIKSGSRNKSHIVKHLELFVVRTTELYR